MAKCYRSHLLFSGIMIPDQQDGRFHKPARHTTLPHGGFWQDELTLYDNKFCSQSLIMSLVKLHEPTWYLKNDHLPGGIF